MSKTKTRHTKDQLLLHASSKALSEPTKWTEPACVHIYFAMSLKKTPHLLKPMQKRNQLFINN